MGKHKINKPSLQCMLTVFITLLNINALYLANPLYENISHIANVSMHPVFVFVWASSFSIYLLLYTPPITKRFAYSSTLGIFLYRCACVGMIISILIPYMPDNYPFLSNLHISLSMTSTLLYVVCFLHILYKGFFYNTILVQRLLPMYIAIVGCCALLYLLLGCVSTLLEVCFVISMCWYFLYINKGN